MSDDEPDFIDPEQRPDDVPEKFVKVPSNDAGYAVSAGDLWAERVNDDDGEKYGDEFMLRLVDSVRSDVDASLTVARAVRSADDVPSALRHCVDGRWFRGDYSDLKALIPALNHYEKFEAGMGEDKIAYEIRTTCNHAKRAVRKRTAPDASR